MGRTCKVVFAWMFTVFFAAQARAQCGDLVLHNFLESGGTSGVVLTSPRGAAVVGGNFGLRVENAAPVSLGFLVWSGVEIAAFDPVFGATLFVGSPFSARFFATNVSGNSPLLFPTPEIDPDLCGAQAVFQAGVFDTLAPGGAAITDALRVRVGDPNDTLFPEMMVLDSYPGAQVFGQPESKGLSDMLFADMNGDGVVDHLMCADPATHQYDYAYLQLGLADGAFEPVPSRGPSLPIDGPIVDMRAHRPQAIAVADFDGDGKLDFATANLGGTPVPAIFPPTPSGVSVVLGDGVGSFIVKRNFGAGSDSRSIALADFDLDGNVDAVTADYLDDTLSMLLGDGLGSLGPAQPFATGPGPWCVVAADLDEDGLADLVSTSSGAASLSVLLANGLGSFAAAVEHTVGSTPVDVVLVDFDGDTLLDAVNTNNSPGSISFSRGLGDGSFSPSIETLVGTDPRDLAVGDVDGDSNLDVATSNHFDETVTLLFGDGTGAFTASTVDAADIAEEGVIGLADADRDGDLDIVVDSEMHVYAHLNRGDGSFPYADGIPLSSVPTSRIAVADLDSDKHSDLVTVSPATGTLSVFLGRAGEAPATPLIYPASSALYPDLEILDFNGDAALDVRVTDSLMFGNGDGTLAAPVPFTTTYIYPQGKGDFDGDDVLDVVIGKTTLPHGLEVRLGNGDGTFGAPSATIAWGAGFLDVVVGDLDGDGNQDLVLADAVLDRVITAFGDGAGGFPTLKTKPVPEYPSNFHLLDLDHNGGLELLLEVGATLSVMPVLPSGLFGPATPLAVGEVLGPFHEVTSVADVNDDGNLDIVQLIDALNNRRIEVLFGNGDLTFGRLITYFVRSEGDAEFGDFDGDGILDIVAAGDSGITIYPSLLGE